VRLQHSVDPSSTDALARSPIWLYAHLVPLRLFDGELVARRRCVAAAVFIWSKDIYVILSSSEDFCVKLAA
jgi:hypothetical protein